MWEGGIPIEKVPHLAVLDDALEEAGNVVYLCEFLHVVTESRSHGVRRCEVRGWLTQLGLSLFTGRSSYNLLVSLQPSVVVQQPPPRHCRFNNFTFMTSLQLKWQETASQFAVKRCGDSLERHLNAILISYLSSRTKNALNWMKSHQELSVLD